MIDTIFDRRTVRTYQEKPVNPDFVQDVLRAGMFAPSGKNMQSWHFVVFDDVQKVRELVKLHPYAVSLKTAPVCIMVCGDTKAELAPGFYVCDCSAATENMLLAAKAFGLDTCWMGIYPWEELTETFIKTFDLPSHIKPFCLIALGYGAEKIERPRRNDESKIHYNKW